MEKLAGHLHRTALALLDLAARDAVLLPGARLDVAFRRFRESTRRGERRLMYDRAQSCRELGFVLEMNSNLLFKAT